LLLKFIFTILKKAWNIEKKKTFSEVDPKKEANLMEKEKVKPLWRPYV